MICGRRAAPSSLPFMKPALNAPWNRTTGTSYLVALTRRPCGRPCSKRWSAIPSVWWHSCPSEQVDQDARGKHSEQLSRVDELRKGSGLSRELAPQLGNDLVRQSGFGDQLLQELESVELVHVIQRDTPVECRDVWRSVI